MCLVLQGILRWSHLKINERPVCVCVSVMETEKESECTTFVRSLWFTPFSCVSCSCVWERLPERWALHRAQQMCLCLRFHWSAVRERWELILVSMLIPHVMILHCFSSLPSLYSYDRGFLVLVPARYLSGKTKGCWNNMKRNRIFTAWLSCLHFCIHFHKRVLVTKYIAVMSGCADITNGSMKSNRTRIYGARQSAHLWTNPQFYHTFLGQ